MGTVIEATDTVQDSLVKLSEGNPGALTVLLTILQTRPQDAFVLLHLDQMEMRGPSIWIGFKDHCKEDLETFCKLVQSRDDALIATVNANGGHAVKNTLERSKV